MAGGLIHRTIYEARDACSKILPLTKGVASKIHLKGSYPLFRLSIQHPDVLVTPLLEILRVLLDRLHLCIILP
jgi:hypothetical protein